MFSDTNTIRIPTALADIVAAAHRHQDALADHRPAGEHVVPCQHKRRALPPLPVPASALPDGFVSDDWSSEDDGRWDIENQ